MNPKTAHTRRTFIQTATVASAVAVPTLLLATESKSSSKISRTIETDVLVCGGGCAGIAAALSSARNGAKTLLIERAGFAGGIITTVGLPYFDGLIDKPSGRFVVKGIALELLQKLGVAREGANHIDDLPHQGPLASRSRRSHRTRSEALQSPSATMPHASQSHARDSRPSEREDARPCGQSCQHR